MASPQVENGHIRIATEIVKKLARLNLSAYEWRVLWAVWLKTWGWHKKFDNVPLSQIAKMTGIQRSHVTEAKMRLIRKNILLAHGDKIGFQKDYEQWDTKNRGGPDSGTPPLVPIQGPSITTITTSQKIEEKTARLHQVFDHWNSNKGKSVRKQNKDGGEVTVIWRSHKLRLDGSISPDIETAITDTLKAKYSVEQICGAIDNYALTLLSVDYWWSHVWPLSTFLTVKYGTYKNAEHKWWQFLPDNFDEGKYLTAAAKRNRANQAKGPNPLNVARKQIEQQRTNPREQKQTA